MKLLKIYDEAEATYLLGHYVDLVVYEKALSAYAVTLVNDIVSYVLIRWPPKFCCFSHHNIHVLGNAS